MSWYDHLLVLPILIPMLAGAIMLPLGEKRRKLKVAIGLVSALSLLVLAVGLLYVLGKGSPEGPWPQSIAVYIMANWSAPFGIVLVADRLTALMLTTAALLGLCALVYSVARWDKLGVHFHPLFQFILMGVNGAFLTGDIFNLFVFFEIMLAASYGLVLHGSGWGRVRSGLHYIAFNLLASFVFLIGVAIIYGVMGTLNMADLSVKVMALEAGDKALLEAGAAILIVAFLAKSAMWPLNFWLVPAYSVAAPPVSAILAMLTKVGVYAILRVWLLLFHDATGATPGMGATWILYGGFITLAIGTIGLLAAQEIPRVACFSLIVSSGTLLAAIGFGRPEVTSGALFYMVGSTLAVAALFLLVELMDRTRKFGADVLALTMEAFQAEGAMQEAEVDEVGIAIPMAMAFLGLAFAGAAIVLAGLPPLTGFLAKFAMLSAALNPEGLGASAQPLKHVWIWVTLVILSGLAALISLSRAGVRVFWAAEDRVVPRLRLSEAGPIALLLLVCVGLTAGAGPAMRYLDATAEALHSPHGYASAVMGSTSVLAPTHHSPLSVP